MLNNSCWIETQTIQWRPSAPFTLDVACFEEAIEQAQATDSARQTVQTTLIQAVDIYTADLLPKFFDEWLTVERDRLRSLYQYALERLIDLFSDAREYTAAIGYAERLLRHDPLHEVSYRRLILLHAQREDYAAVESIYQDCVSTLRSAMNVEPSPATVALRERLSQRGKAPNFVVIPSGDPPVAGMVTFPLVGRQAEWQQLSAAWRCAQASQPHVLLIKGEAGIGKTRLAEEFLTTLDHQGVTTLVARCYSGEETLSYAPTVTWLRSGAVQTQLSKLDDLWLIELSRLLPEVQIRRTNLPAPEPLTHSSQRQRLFEAVAHALLAVKAPKLLLLDDLQWCDVETLDWLNFLLHFAPRAQLLVMCTMRTEEVPIDHPLTAWRLELTRRRQFREIELGLLEDDETLLLGAEVMGGALDADFERELIRETEGHPLFVVETIRAKQGGTSEPFSNGPSEWQANGAHQTHRFLPATIQHVIEARLNQLGATTRELINLAAVIGRKFAVNILAAAANADEATLINALDEALQRRIIREQGANTYDFSHDRIREVAYATLSATRRQWFHRRVAHAFQQLYQKRLDTVSHELAMHFDAGGMTKEAVTFHQKAATVATQIYANQTAIHHLTKGIALLQTLPKMPEYAQQELELQSTLGVPLVAVKGIGAAEVGQSYARVRALCQELDMGGAYLSVLWGQTAYLNTRAELGEARRLGEYLLELAKQENDSAKIIMAYRGLGPTCSHQGELRLAQQYMDQAIALYDLAQHRELMFDFGVDPAIICRCFGMLNLWALGRNEDADTWSRSAQTLAQALGQPFSQALVHVFVAWLHIVRRDAAAAKVASESAIVLSEQHQLAQPLAMATMFHSCAIAQLGEWHRGIDRFREGLDAYHATGAAIARPRWLAMLTELCLHVGQLADADVLLAEALATVEKTGERFGEAELYRLMGELACQHGSTSEAEAHFQHAINIARHQDALAWELGSALSLAQLWHEQGRRIEARQALATVCNRFHDGFDAPTLQEAQALLHQLT